MRDRISEGIAAGDDEAGAEAGVERSSGGSIARTRPHVFERHG
jgi:hypothetical protein